MSKLKFDGKCLKSGSSTIANVRGDKICHGSGTNGIASMKEVNNDIDGAGHVVKAALWLYFVR